MSGKNTLWVPGTDHAGIATQQDYDLPRLSIWKSGSSRGNTQIRSQTLVHGGDIGWRYACRLFCHFR
ncbi:MAG: hypothetical protein POG24_08240 [Acidocella sp.]|nr:hypothetical protein [Acidocella sp.]